MTTFSHAAVDAYAPLARHYDRLTAAYRHDVWLDRIEQLALAHGLAGRRLLDVACGTGKSFEPMLERGYVVTGADISAEMLDVARERAHGAVALHHADMRDLPAIGPFDLVTCLDDAVNYLLGDDDLAEALASIAATMAPGGLLAFDANTLATYRDLYTASFVLDEDDAFLCWHGHGTADDPDGPVRASATVEVFERGADDRWSRSRSVHRQRHWPREDVLAALGRASLEPVRVLGQRIGVVLEDHVDESEHTKTLYLARAA